MREVFKFCGGRKMFLSFLALICGSVAAMVLGATFVEYISFVGGVLGLGAGSVAWEDRSKENGHL